MLGKDLLLLDVETTGLDPRTSEIIQLSACVLSRHDLSELSSFSMRVRPSRPIAPQAKAVHGLSEEDLRNEPSLRVAIEAFERFTPKSVILCGHNVAFDVGFLKAAYEQVSQPYTFDYHTVDVWSLAFFMLGARGIELRSYNLNALCSFYGIARERYHDALQDVRASAAVLRHLFAAARESNIEIVGQLSLGGL